MRWTDKDLKYLIENKDADKADIAEHLNRSVPAISQKIRQLGLTETKKTVTMTRVAKFYIEENKDTMSAEDIAIDLDMDVEEVEAAMARNTDIVTQPKPKHPKTQIQRMHDRTREETKNVTIMTEGISERGDEVRQTGKQKDLPHVHKIHEDR